MNKKSLISDSRFPVEKPDGSARLVSVISRRAFSLIELMVVVSLLALIVLVLMTVFNSTQAAFRSGVTQTDVLEGGRAAMDLITSDLKVMASSGSYSNSADVPYALGNAAVNFYAGTNFFFQPLFQGLPPYSGVRRTNILQNFFFLSRDNLSGHDSWVGTGYAVDSLSTNYFCPLYRFSTNLPASADPAVLLNVFMNVVTFRNENNFTNAGWSHLIDGVVDMRVRAYDVNGTWLTNGLAFGQKVTAKNVRFTPPQWNETGCYFFSNTIPASVEVQLGVLEDRPLQRAESLPFQSAAQTTYLEQQAGHVRVFRQRVIIPNVDRTAYQ